VKTLQTHLEQDLQELREVEAGYDEDYTDE
jgi:hypothetical protein